MRRLAIMADAVDPQTMLERNTVRALANKFGIDPIPLEVRRTEDIEPAFAKLKSERADALYVVINELLNANRLLSSPQRKQQSCRPYMALTIGSDPEVSFRTVPTSRRFSRVWPK